MASTEQTHRSFVGRLFAGDLGLPVTFWGFAVAVPLVLSVLISNLQPAPDLKAPLIALVSLSVAWHVFIGIAVWRAAKSSSRRLPWWLLARIYSVAMFIRAYAMLMGLMRLTAEALAASVVA